MKQPGRWDLIVQSLLTQAGSGRPWTRLDPPGLGAVIAYCAGPGWVRPVGHAMARRSAVSGPFWRDEATQDALVDEYVVAAGLAAAPYAEWEIDLSPTDTAQLWGAVNEAIDRVAPTHVSRATSLSGAELAEVASAVAAFLGARERR